LGVFKLSVKGVEVITARCYRADIARTMLSQDVSSSVCLSVCQDPVSSQNG